jgi:hypothetical protein
MSTHIYCACVCVCVYIYIHTDEDGLQAGEQHGRVDPHARTRAGALARGPAARGAQGACEAQDARQGLRRVATSGPPPPHSHQ